MITLSRILCPVDFSEFSARAVAHAVAMAKWYEARLTLLHVFVNMGAVDLPPIPLDAEDRERLLADLRRLAGTPAGVRVDAVVREGADATREILRQIEEDGTDLLVLGSHGRGGFERLLLGSVTEKLLRRAPCPLMIVPRAAPDVPLDQPVQFRSILCPLDFSEGSLEALTYAFSLAQESDATLTLLHSIEIPPELTAHLPPAEMNPDAIRAAAEAASLRHLRDLVPDSVREYCTVETLVLEGAAYRQIPKVAAARNADLIVMGVQGRRAMDLLVFGSTTARVTREATCPVLVVRTR